MLAAAGLGALDLLERWAQGEHDALGESDGPSDHGSSDPVGRAIPRFTGSAGNFLHRLVPVLFVDESKVTGERLDTVCSDEPSRGNCMLWKVIREREARRPALDDPLLLLWAGGREQNFSETYENEENHGAGVAHLALDDTAQIARESPFLRGFFLSDEPERKMDLPPTTIPSRFGPQPAETEEWDAFWLVENLSKKSTGTKLTAREQDQVSFAWFAHLTNVLTEPRALSTMLSVEDAERQGKLHALDAVTGNGEDSRGAITSVLHKQCSAVVGRTARSVLTGSWRQRHDDSWRRDAGASAASTNRSAFPPILPFLTMWRADRGSEVGRSFSSPQTQTKIRKKLLTDLVCLSLFWGQVTPSAHPGTNFEKNLEGSVEMLEQIQWQLRHEREALLSPARKLLLEESANGKTKTPLAHCTRTELIGDYPAADFLHGYKVGENFIASSSYPTPASPIIFISGLWW